MSRRVRGALLALALVWGVAAGGAPPAAATIPPRQGSAARLDVVSQTTTVAADGTFLLALDVVDPPAGGRVDVTFYADPVAGREGFSRSLFGVDLDNGDPDNAIALTPIQVDDLARDGDRARTYVAISLLRSATPAPGQIALSLGLQGPGAYPVEVSLVDGDGNQRSRVITHLVRLPDADDMASLEPLRTALVVPLHAPPSVQPRGGSEIDPRALDRIQADVAALDDVPGVPLTLAPTPETVEAIARDEPALAADLDEALDGRSVLDAPYVDLAYTSWVDADMDTELEEQRVRGSRVLTEQLEPPDSSTWLGDADLTTRAAESLWQVGVRELVLPPGAVGGTASDPNRPFRIAAPAATPLLAMTNDTAVASAFERVADPELGALQFLAELSVAQLVEPDARRGAVVVPGRDRPASTALLSAVLTGLADHPLLVPRTVDDVFDEVLPARADGGAGAVVERSLEPLPPPGLGSYPTDLARVRSRVESYATMLDRDDPLVQQWRQRLLTSGAAELSTAQQGRYLAVIEDDIDGRVAQIDAPDTQTVTLTSATGSIPLTIRNGLDGPIQVTIALEASSRIEFPDGDRQLQVLEPGTRQMRIPVLVRSPGVSPVSVRVLSPDGGIELTATRVQVRSTAISGIGWILSAGAAGFLLLWWARHWRRARKAQHSPAPPTGEASA